MNEKKNKSLPSHQNNTLQNYIYKLFVIHQGNQFYHELLALILKEMSSEFGLIGYLDESENLVIPTLTGEILACCQIKDKKNILLKSDLKGIFAQVISQHKSVLVNNSEPLKTPDGHIKVKRVLFVPILYNRQLLGIIAVADKKSDYQIQELQKLEEIAELFAPVLYGRRHRDLFEQSQIQFFQSAKLASIGTLAAGIAHEINNPLTILSGFWNIIREHLSEQMPLSPELDEYFSNGGNAIMRIKDIVQGLKDFARVDTNDHNVFDLIKIVNNSLRLCHNIYQRDDIEIEANILVKDALVCGNQGKTQQVIFNLLNNARDAIKEQKRNNAATSQHPSNYRGKILLTLSQSNTSKEYLLHIQDNGHGITESHTHQIFNPFFTTKNTGEGSGLGLYISHSIIKSMNGSITFSKNATTEGVIFTVHLPIYEEISSGVKTPDTRNKSKGVVLIIDDEADIRKMLRVFLESISYKVIEATNGIDALDALQVNGIDAFKCIITDLKMPRLSGFELIKEARARGFSGKIITITGNIYLGDDNTEELEILPLIQGQLHKPFSKKDVFELLERPLVFVKEEDHPQQR
ncbi:MAG: hybrid sensor histidine kinase/response regulator [Oligoflexia bacterium]|nr:hybrid sensor histidine kinase/response regulator [Oligoflexia bacterium]MBF0364543.1 hybrid sensor histidine kinase/response regulator [Oligoflexia bacterium]